MLGAVAIAVVLLFRRGLLVANVHGRSMSPTYSDGDRLLAVRRGLWRELREGDVVVCRLPAGYSLPGVGAEALIVKRVATVEASAGTVYVLGDAPAHSMDSREFGALPEALVVGVVLRRLSTQSR